MAIATHYNLKVARRRAGRSGLLLAKFVLRMHRNCYFRASGQNSRVPTVCKRLKTDIAQLTENAKKMYDKRESTRNVSFVTQGNALRRSAKEKQKQVDKLLKDIDEQQLVLKQM